MTTQIAGAKTNIQLNHDPDMIWGMLEGNDTISMRFDCGDAGMIVFTIPQARELCDQLSEFIISSGK